MLIASPPEADVNWLLSTAVQSGAALVAIIGGLIVARLVGLTGERGAAQRQLVTLRERVTYRERQVEEACEAREDLEAACFLNYAEDDFIKAHGHLSSEALDDLIARSRWDVTPRTRTQVVLPAMERVHRAFLAITDALGEVNPHRVDADEWIDQLIDDPADRPLHRDALDQLKEEIPKPAKPQSQYSWMAYSPVLDMPRITPAPYGAADKQTRDRRLDEAGAEILRSEAVLRDAKDEVKAAERALVAASRPEGLGYTVAALIYLAVVCLVFPLSLMTWGRMTLPAWCRVLVVAAFVSGLVVFLVELLRLMNSLATSSSVRSSKDASDEG